MGKIAFLFSGQGAQYPGMGKSLCEASEAARRCSIWRIPSVRIPLPSAFPGRKRNWSRTENTQPCVYCVESRGGGSPESQRDCAGRGGRLFPWRGGCLRSAGCLPRRMASGWCASALPLWMRRRSGQTLACRCAEALRRACGELCAAHPGTYPVNYNCPGQVSVAGEKTALEGLCKAVQEAGGRAVPLAVSGGFHSPMMDSAAAQMQEELKQVEVSAPGDAALCKLYGRALCAGCGGD